MIPSGTYSTSETPTTGPMIPSGTNNPPVARVIDPVIETLTTGPMIPSRINSPPVARVIDPVIVIKKLDVKFSAHVAFMYPIYLGYYMLVCMHSVS